AADLAVLYERSLEIRLNIDFHHLAAIRARDDKLIFHYRPAGLRALHTDILLVHLLGRLHLLAVEALPIGGVAPLPRSRDKLSHQCHHRPGRPPTPDHPPPRRGPETP